MAFSFIETNCSGVLGQGRRTTCFGGRAKGFKKTNVIFADAITFELLNDSGRLGMDVSNEIFKMIDDFILMFHKVKPNIKSVIVDEQNIVFI